jgi:signal transduction histidine kinase
MDRTAASRRSPPRNGRTTPARVEPIGPRLRALERASANGRPDRAMLDALVRGLDAGVVMVDPAGRVAEINAAAARMLELPAPRARGRVAADVIHTMVPGEDPLRDAFRARGGECEVVLRTGSDGELPVRLSARRLGRPAWTVVVLRDLTQARRMQQELRRHERLATLGQLAAGVAHEIRNPLAGIGTSAQVMMRRFEPRDDRARFVKVILEEVERLDRIVRSLLQYGRPATPRLRPEPIAPCVTRVIELCAEPIEQAGVHVDVDVSPRLEAVYIDPDLVTQVLLNVTLNAVQAMSAGPRDRRRLRYEVRQLRRRAAARGPGRRASDAPRRRPAGPPDGGWVTYQQVRVIDGGPGIPRGVLDKLFDPFFTTKPRGTGLGLSISQTIMQDHGGSIAIASREGRGTTVLLNFPVEKRHGERRSPDADVERTDAAHR